jgi:hypothetical protein
MSSKGTQFANMPLSFKSLGLKKQRDLDILQQFHVTNSDGTTSIILRLIILHAFNE